MANNKNKYMLKFTYFATLTASLFLFLLVFPVSVQAATYYVSSSGSDANPGLQTSPWRTIQKAANTLNSGNTVIVLAGTYGEKVSVSRSGIIFRASGLVNMKGFYITGNNITVKGFSITNLNNTEENGIDARGSNIVIEQNIINDVPSNGIEVRGSNSIIKNNIVSRGRNAGIFIAGQNNLIENNDVSKIIQPKPHSSGGDANCMSFFGSGHIFRGNYCHDIYSDGVLVTDAHIDAFQTWNWTSMGGVGHDVLFEKNILTYPIKGQEYFGKGWNMEEGAYNITIKNNVILANLIVLIIDGNNISFQNNTFVGISNTSDGLHLRRTNVTMYNNIFAHQQQRIIENLESSSTITAGNNCYVDYGILLPANPGDVRSTNALFVNESSRDYHLQSGSPCINKGTVISAVTEDKDGVSRPQGAGYDIGAYEYPSAPAGKAGDANGDNKIDGVDYVVWLNHYNQSVSSPSNGDFNNSGKVDGVDYVIWLNNYGK